MARACHGCGQTGRRRTQLVVTVANLDTGAVASHLHLRERDEIRHLATAPDLVTAITALGLR
nr:hypothetical protein [Micromonospora sp. DSM 115978]